MDHLWSPWRYQYVTKALPQSDSTCVFCDMQSADDATALIVHRAQHNFVVLNLYPYNAGHILIVPYQHIDSLEHCAEPALIEMMLLTRHAEAVLRKVYRPKGINAGLNLGECAGAGIAGHIHMHLLPRWVGDANFLSVIGETRVLPEELSITWQRLRAAW